MLEDAFDDGGLFGGAGAEVAALVSMEAWWSRAWTWAMSAPPWRSRVP
ncbi:hypothetical protein [Nocardia nova]|nr:hypothetical protein [Nocardia nova]MBF6278051.1 hypothetical protein [Nocardia nova]